MSGYTLPPSPFQREQREVRGPEGTCAVRGCREAGVVVREAEWAPVVYCRPHAFDAAARFGVRP